MSPLCIHFRIQYGWHSVQETTIIYVSNYSFNHWRGGKKKVWRDSLNLFQSLKCKRTSEVKSTFSVTFYPPLISIILVVLFWS